MKKITIYCDGAARGNPGPAGAGAVLLDINAEVIAEVSKYLGKTTNNQAEYQALILSLTKAKELGANEISIFSDSELMVKQIKGEYRVKHVDLKPVFKIVVNLLKEFNNYNIKHLPREKNKYADKLANKAIDNNVL